MDNGGEFSCEEMREITSVLNIHVPPCIHVTMYHGWGKSFSECERVHAITDMMLVKLLAEYGKINPQTLLSWANMARNPLQMWNGFSCHQLVFGENPNLPNLINDNLPALEGTMSSEVFARHLNTLHAARRVFIQTEADERMTRALRNKVRASE